MRQDVHRGTQTQVGVVLDAGVVSDQGSLIKTKEGGDIMI